MANESNQPTATANPDLASLHTQLISVVDKLNAAFGRAKTKPEAIAILDEIIEVNARVNALGRQLFTQQTAAITRGARKVADAMPEIEDAIRRSEELKNFVQGVTKFLKTVDAVIDVAKLVI